MDLVIDQAALFDSIEEEFLAEVKNDEILEFYARGFIGLGDVAQRLEYALMQANIRANKRFFGKLQEVCSGDVNAQSEHTPAPVFTASEQNPSDEHESCGVPA